MARCITHNGEMGGIERVCSEWLTEPSQVCRRDPLGDEGLGIDPDAKRPSLAELLADDGTDGAKAVLKAKIAMYEAWLREHVPDCPLLAENIIGRHELLSAREDWLADPPSVEDERRAD